MPANVQLNSDFENQLNEILDGKLGELASDLKDEARNVVGTPFPPASQPGTPPHKRTGGFQEAIFCERVASLEWVYGVKQVLSDDGRERRDLGLWMELGTGRFRRAFPAGATSVASIPHDTATTGHGSGVQPRPFLLPTLMNHGPRLAQQGFGGGS